jgi:glutamate carboxypeptidase
LAAASRWLSDQLPLMIEQLVGWVEICSGSHRLDGLVEMANALEDSFTDLPAAFARHDLPVWETIDGQGNPHHCGTGPALTWTCRPTARARVLLGIHYDTVYDHPPQGRPAARWLSDNRLSGPGAADAKGGLVALLWTLRACERFALAPDLGWTVVLTPDEELGSPASHGLWTELAERHRWGLLFEPALPDGTLVAARKGSGNFSIVVRGRSSHVGRHPEAGRNAIYQAARMVTELERLHQPATGLIVNVARIEGGSPVNVVPDLAVIRLNVRIQAADQADALLQRLQELVRQANATEGFQASLHGGITAPPKPSDSRAQQLQRIVEQAAGDLGRTIQWRDTGGVCDGNRLAAAGLTNVDTMGPCGDGLHSPAEWVELDSLWRSAELAAATLHRLHASLGDGGVTGAIQ